MRILGIDPGLAIVGFGLIEAETGKTQMLQYGAVNAANLDGGSSTTMVLDGKLINKTCGPAGPRFLPNAWLVF